MWLWAGALVVIFGVLRCRTIRGTIEEAPPTTGMTAVAGGAVVGLAAASSDTSRSSRRVELVAQLPPESAYFPALPVAPRQQEQAKRPPPEDSLEARYLGVREADSLDGGRRFLRFSDLVLDRSPQFVDEFPPLRPGPNGVHQPVFPGPQPVP